MVHGGLPGGDRDLVLVHLEDLGAVDEPGDRLGCGVRPVHDHGVGVEGGLAAGAGLQAAADAGGLVARAAGVDAAVEGAGVVGQRVDVFEDVDLAGHRPGARAEHPEGRPVAEAAGRIGLLDRGGYFEFAAGRGADIGGVGLDPARGPGAARVDRLDHQVTISVEKYVTGRVGHGLDLAGTEARPWAGVVLPVS